MIARTRTTAATQRRIANMHILLAALSTRDMMRDEFCELLHFSPSGARKYIRELREAGVIEVARYVDPSAHNFGMPVYRLVSGTADAFLAETCEVKKAPAVKRRETVATDPSRHMHIMGDDVFYSARSPRVVVARDPLIEAFFGPAKVLP